MQNVLNYVICILVQMETFFENSNLNAICSKLLFLQKYKKKNDKNQSLYTIIAIVITKQKHQDLYLFNQFSGADIDSDSSLMGS